jgi:3-methyladenine DNA glycosylase AlkD
VNKIQARLFELQDLEYKKFHSKLMPTVVPDRVIGVRMPILRALAKEIINSGQAESFLADLPHRYYEENNLHGLIISTEKDFDRAVIEIEKLLPYVDNWATCDSMIPKSLENDPERLILKVRQWLASEHTYTVRFGINILMKFFLNDKFKPEYAEWVAELRDNDYYVMMGAAWYFATALSKQYASAVEFLEQRKLPEKTHNKAIQKALESYCISNEKKTYLKSLKIKRSTL